MLTFKHGVHPEEYKELTHHLPVERMPFVEEYTIPLSQHIGAPSIPVVRKGQRVNRGETIAKPGGFVSVAQHSPITGTIIGIERSEHPGGQLLPAIKIKTDPFSSQQLITPPRPSWKTLEPSEFIGAVQAAGIVGLGGAAFPTHVKFSIPEGKKCQYIIINGCECEPFLTSDHRVMVEQTSQLITGICILINFLKPEKIFIGIEANKPEAIKSVSEELKALSLPVNVIPLQVKYPQGAEKMLITAILDRDVPSGKLPLDVSTLVSNAGTVAVLADFFTKAQPLIERVVTVTGPGIKRPANVLAPIGTPIGKIIETCGGLKPETSRILLGGPMMGIAQKRLDAPVVKGTSGILALTDYEIREQPIYKCIRCGRCLDACPVFLNPSRLGLLARKRLYDDMTEEHLMDCIECGSCSFVCPSHIPLVQQFRVSKAILREKQAAA